MAFTAILVRKVYLDWVYFIYLNDLLLASYLAILALCVPPQSEPINLVRFTIMPELAILGQHIHPALYERPTQGSSALGRLALARWAEFRKLMFPYFCPRDIDKAGVLVARLSLNEHGRYWI